MSFAVINSEKQLNSYILHLFYIWRYIYVYNAFILYGFSNGNKPVTRDGSKQPVDENDPYIFFNLI